MPIDVFIMRFAVRIFAVDAFNKMPWDELGLIRLPVMELPLELLITSAAPVITAVPPVISMLLFHMVLLLDELVITSAPQKPPVIAVIELFRISLSFDEPFNINP